MDGFAERQAGLGAALAANQPGGGDHVLVALPSFSVGESLLSHYADRIPALEHRYLLSTTMLARIPGCELVFVTCQEPWPDVLQYYAALSPQRPGQLRVIEVPDPGPRSVAAKLLDRPDLIDELRASFRDRPALVEPWNVTADEVEVAARLGAPINGTDPDLLVLGTKSGGREVFRAVGVPLPYGFEHLRSVDDVVDAVERIRADRPDAPGAVVKHDDSGAGDGNAVIRFADGEVRAAVEALPDWYRDDLALGAVAEELVAGGRFTSPSAQVDVLPDGRVVVLATHEQVLGGDDGQVYLGCRFPAEPAYAAALADAARRVGEHLAGHGVVGRLSVDFAVVQPDGGGRAGVFALEINLRKGGTTHPYAALRNLVPGAYDEAGGTWVAQDGSTRAYVATDNLVDERRIGVPPGRVIEAVAAAGLAFDRETGVGVVLHMLSCLAIDGRFGLTAIGRTPAEATELQERLEAAVASL